MKFFKKKEQPKTLQPKTLLEEYLEKCNNNTKNILKSIAKKREELFKDNRVKGKEKEIDAILYEIADFLTGIEWESRIQQTLDNCRMTDIDGAPTSRIDKEPFVYLLNLYWADIKDTVNSKIMEVIKLTEGEKNEKGNSTNFA